MKQLDKQTAMKLLESFEQESTELDDLVRNACSIIYSVAEQMTWETSDPYESLFNAIVDITKAINDTRRYNVRL